MYQNLAYRFLSSQDHRNDITIYPFVDSWSHHKSNADMLRPISIPDVPLLPTDVLLIEGDFTTIFNENPQRYSKLHRFFHPDRALPSKVDKFDGSEYFDVVTTHFFIDTARNIMSYFDTIHKILKSGGYWINFGPLLYGTGPWVQLSLEEIVAVVESLGFEFIQMDGMGIAREMHDVCGEVSRPEKGVREKEAIYGFDERALTKNAYAAQFWVVRKK
jgi:carnosine N-methyltransferase